jgi:hypothetical protein
MHDKDGQLQGERDPKNREIPHTRVEVEANCQNCHRKTSDGAFMQPIVYEHHCQGCHAITADIGRLTNTKSVGSVKVVHEKPAIVRGFLLEQIVAANASAGKENLPLLPERPVPGAEEPPLSEFYDANTAVGSQIKQIEHSLFGEEADGGCRYCHTVRAPAKSKDGTLTDWTVVPPKIPDVWLPHAHFNHESHRFLSCLACHTGVAKAEGEMSAGDAPVTALSDSVSDVNISNISACYGCHAQSAEGRTQTTLKPHDTGPVPTRCIDCHTYHGRK